MSVVDTDEDDERVQAEAVYSVMSSHEREIFEPRSSMSLEYLGDERKLMLIYGTSELLLSPDQVISLLQSPHKSVVLSNFEIANEINSSQTKYNLIGTLQKSESCIQTYSQLEEIPVGIQRACYEDYCFFYVDMKRLLLYYTLLKREKAERTKFHKLRKKIQFNPVDDKK